MRWRASEVQAEKMFNFLHAHGGLLGGGQLQFLLSAAWGQGGAVRELISARQFARGSGVVHAPAASQPMEQGSWSDSSWWGAAKNVSREECVHTHMHMSLHAV